MTLPVSIEKIMSNEFNQKKIKQFFFKFSVFSNDFLELKNKISSLIT